MPGADAAAPDRQGEAVDGRPADDDEGLWRRRPGVGCDRPAIVPVPSAEAGLRARQRTRRRRLRTLQIGSPFRPASPWLVHEILEALAGPGEVLVSETTRDFAEGAGGLRFESRGRHRLRGLNRDRDLFAVGASGRNRLIDHLRREEREERRRFRLVVREIPASSSPETMRSHDERADIVDTLRRLPAGQRAALILHHVDDLSIREVATTLHRTEGAVEALLSRGRAKFREIYEETDRE